MPRVIDPQKYDYAKILLAQNKPIESIRNELKNLFNSSISPNRLIKMKKEIEKKRNVKKNKESSSPIPFLIQERNIIKKDLPLNDLIESNTQNTILIQKLWRSFQEFENFLKFLNPMIQSINEKLERLDLGNNKKNKGNKVEDFLSDDLILDELHKRRAIILDLLDRYEELDISSLNQYSGIDINILEWNLHELIEFGMVESIEIENQKKYRYIKFTEDEV